MVMAAFMVKEISTTKQPPVCHKLVHTPPEPCTRLPWVGVDNASQEVKLPSLPPTASSPCRDHWKEDHSQSSSATQVILRSVISSEVNQCCISLSVPSETLSQIIVVSYCIIRHSYM